MVVEGVAVVRVEMALVEEEVDWLPVGVALTVLENWEELWINEVKLLVS